MEKIAASLLATAGIACAQTYNYDSSSETLVITGKGNTVADRITLEGPITPGSTVPGTSEIFGDTKEIILKDVWTSPDSIRIKYVEPTSEGNNTTLKLENSRLGASGDFDKGGTGLILILDSQSSLELYGNRLTNTIRIENQGNIKCTNGTVSASSYLWDNKTTTGSSGVLGGSGYYSFGNVSSIETNKDFGLIKTSGQITDLEISGIYTVDGNSAKTIGDDSYIVGVNTSSSSDGQAMTISGSLTINAKQGTGIGILANQLGSDDVSLKNNYSGQIYVTAKDAFGVKVGKNAVMDPSAAGDIYSLSVGELDIESTITSGSTQGEATGIYAKSVKRDLTANAITVNGYTNATGIHLTEGGRNLTISDMQVSAGISGNAAGIIAAPGRDNPVSTAGNLENIRIDNLEVSGGADATGIFANSITKSGQNENIIGNITVSSENGLANGIFADNADITLGGKILSSSENSNAYGIWAENELHLKMLDGSEISAIAANENSSTQAIRSKNLYLTFDGSATINGDLMADAGMELNNGGNVVVNGNIEGKHLAAESTIGTVSGKMKFDSVAGLNITASVGSLEIGMSGEDSGYIKVNTVETSANISNAVLVTIENANGNVSFNSVNSATVNNAVGDISATNVTNGLNVGDVGNIRVSGTNVNVLDGKTVSGDIVSTTDLILSNEGSATLTGSVSAGGNRLTINSVFGINSSAATVISAGTLGGAGLRGTINNHYDNIFGFSATDDSSGSLTAATALKGTHDVVSNNISGMIDGDLDPFENTYITVKYVNVGSNVGYEIEKNTYLAEAVATNEFEKALAKTYDDLEYIDGDDAANEAAVTKKRNFAAMVKSGTLGAILPQSVVHSVRMNMDLADIIHLDTLNRTSAAIDGLGAKSSGTEVSGGRFSGITVRNINRFATYGGDENMDGSSDYISGGLVNFEYTAGNTFLAGFGFGGFQAKSSGKGNCGKAETQSLAVNAYTDWRFFGNFDWYFGATYAFGMNKAERMNILNKSKADWNSNLIGVFTGVRYAWKPFADTGFYLKPTIGVNADFLMNPSFTEKSGEERMSAESENYTSVKSLVGIEGTYAFSNGFYFTGRMFYTHEFCDDRYGVNAMLGSSFIRVRGWKMDRDAGVFGAGIGYSITEQWSVYADYAADVSDKVRHNVNMGVTFKF